MVVQSNEAMRARALIIHGEEENRGHGRQRKKTGLGEGKMVTMRTKRRIGVKYAKVKDGVVMDDDGYFVHKKDLELTSEVS